MTKKPPPNVVLVGSLEHGRFGSTLKKISMALKMPKFRAAKGSIVIAVSLSTSFRLLVVCVKSGSPAEVNSNAAPKSADGLKVYALKIPGVPVVPPGLIVPTPDNLPVLIVVPPV